MVVVEETQGGMMPEKESLQLFLSCTRYLEEILAEEAEELGARDVKAGVAGVSCRASLPTAYRLCLWSRTASRVYLLIAEGRADSEEELYRAAARVDWMEHFSVNDTFAVTASTAKSPIKNETYAALKIKDGIADSFREHSGRRPSVDTHKPAVRIYGRVESGTVLLYLDLSGESLHKRGYRIEKTEAPLRETSAAAMLLKADWPEIAASGGRFIDPMCGSGTLAVEAVLIAADIAPGLLRGEHGLQHWKKHREGLWRELREEAEKRRDEGIEKIQRSMREGEGEPLFFASDRDAGAVEVCRRNLDRAGLEDLVKTVVCDFREVDSSKSREKEAMRGLIAVNPPYGIRLEEKNRVRELYADLGRRMGEAFSGYRAAVLTAGKDEAKYIGLRAKRVNVFYNASVKGALAVFELGENNTFRPYRPYRDVTDGVQSIVNRIRKNRKSLKKYLRNRGISCYRVYDADIPQYAAAVDVYEERYFVVQEYAPPATVDSRKAAERLKEIVEAVAISFEADRDFIFLKQRRRQSGGRQYEKAAGAGERYVINEGGLRFFVNFTDYLDTGIFLDHRITRDVLRRLADGWRMLNLFAYTCSAGVYAADGGAEHVVSVDTSRTYLDWGRKNFELNRMDPARHSFVRSDALEYLMEAAAEGRRYGLIFIDPPTFSNRKDASADFDVQRDHEKLIETAAEVLHEEGTIVFSNNYRRFRLSPRLEEGFSIKDVSKETIPKDFERNQKIHRSWIMRKEPPREGFFRELLAR